MQNYSVLMSVYHKEKPEYTGDHSQIAPQYRIWTATAPSARTGEIRIKSTALRIILPKERFITADCIQTRTDAIIVVTYRMYHHMGKRAVAHFHIPDVAAALFGGFDLQTGSRLYLCEPYGAAYSPRLSEPTFPGFSGSTSDEAHPFPRSAP